MSVIKIYKEGQLLRIRPVVGKIQTLLCDTLRYTRRKVLMTKFEREAAGGKHVELLQVDCFDLRTISGELQLITNAGFLTRIQQALSKAKISYEVIDLIKQFESNIFNPVWNNVKDFSFRPGQREVLENVVKHDRGRIWWATGTGKSFLIPLICKLYPKANIVVTTKHKAVLCDIYKNISTHLPSVGIYHSTKKILNKRVMCVSAGCLQHMDPAKVHIVLADEVHELATDQMFEKFTKFQNSRLFGFSANMNDRFDGADFELEGLFGPIIAKLSYQEGVQNKIIVPINVHWHHVNLECNPAAGKEGIFRLKYGIWKNTERNRIIADIAKRYEDQQVLITVKTFEHACNLKALLPEYTLVYAVDDKDADMARYVKQKLISADEPKMSLDRLERLKAMFETGALKKVIATTVWNRGVNFKQLEVLIRADASSSALDDTQIPGRLSRTTDDNSKQSGILIDFLDEFDMTLNRKAKARRSDYDSHGWTNIVEKNESSR